MHVQPQSSAMSLGSMVGLQEALARYQQKKNDSSSEEWSDG